MISSSAKQGLCCFLPSRRRSELKSSGGNPGVAARGAGLAVVVLLAACKAPTPTDVPTPIAGDTANYSASLGAEPDFAPAPSVFEGLLYPSDGVVTLQGAFREGPPLSFHSESARSGSCRELTYTPSTCDPPCAAGTEACIDSTCEPYPVQAPRGTVSFSWPGGTADLEPGPTGYFHQGQASGEGALGIAFEDTSLEVPFAPMMEPTGSWETALSDRQTGEDGVLRWSDPREGMRVYLYMTDCTGSHGGLAPVEIECEGPDTGELVVPAAFLDALEQGDWSRGECGSHVFHRRHIAAPDDDASIRLHARSVDSLFWRPDF